jgi:hypothetical protein
MMLMAMVFEEENITYFGTANYASRGDDQSGGITGALIWIVLGLILWRRARPRLNALASGLYWLGIAGCGAIIVLVLGEV